jgi:hypothetical protein
MTGKSPLWATEEQRAELTILAGSRDRGEADRARALLLTLAGWTSPRIAEAFGVRSNSTGCVAPNPSGALEPRPNDADARSSEGDEVEVAKGANVTTPTP